MVLYTIVLCCVTQAVEVNDRVTVVGAICVVIGSIMYSAPMTVIVSSSTEVLLIVLNTCCLFNFIQVSLKQTCEPTFLY